MGNIVISGQSNSIESGVELQSNLQIPLENSILFEEQDDFEQFTNTTANNVSTILEVTEVEYSVNNITSPTPPENATDKNTSNTSKQTFIGRKRKRNSENLPQTIAATKEFSNLQQQKIELKREEIEIRKKFLNLINLLEKKNLNLINLLEKKNLNYIQEKWKF